MEHDIGCKIKAARIEKKLTQEQVAELLGVSRQTAAFVEYVLMCGLRMQELLQVHRHSFRK